MTYEEAEELLEKDEDSYLKSNLKRTEAFIKGLTILAKYDDSIPGAAEHDIIYLARFSEEMPEEEILELHKLGFHLSEDSWAKFA